MLPPPPAFPADVHLGSSFELGGVDAVEDDETGEEPEEEERPVGEIEDESSTEEVEDVLLEAYTEPPTL
jgi:hypothetical protein